MAEAAVAVVREFWRRMQANDFRHASELFSDEFVLEWPQSGERIRGRDAFTSVNEEYPSHGPWKFHIHRIVGNQDEAVSDVSVTDGVQMARAITFFTVRTGRIVAMVEFWPEPYQAPQNRSHLVERFTEER